MLKLSAEHRNSMVSHALRGLPHEACGLFAGKLDGGQKTVEAVYCLDNIDKSAEHFSMAAEDQFAAVRDMRKRGLVLLGNFHSHPETPARPSEEDIRLAFDSSLSYVIISLKDKEPVLKSFLIASGSSEEEPLLE